MKKFFLAAASASGVSAVVFGAFGAHGLKPLLSPESLAMWEKGVQYQFYHTIAMLIPIYLLHREAGKLLHRAVICFLLGIVCFSGSLYLLATRGLTHISAVVLGPITPIGGLFFIIGWGLIFLYAVKENDEQR